jgi:hypothetical protein
MKLVIQSSPLFIFFLDSGAGLSFKVNVMLKSIH